MTPRQKAYFALRGGSAGIFLFSATVLPHGAPAVIGALIGGMGGILTCFAVNAGGPGERAGARAERVSYDTKRAPQGDWPPFPAEMVIDAETGWRTDLASDAARQRSTGSHLGQKRGWRRAL